MVSRRPKDIGTSAETAALAARLSATSDQSEVKVRHANKQ